MRILEAYESGETYGTQAFEAYVYKHHQVVDKTKWWESFNYKKKDKTKWESLSLRDGTAPTTNLHHNSN
jgi:hypothetical protein